MVVVTGRRTYLSQKVVGTAKIIPSLFLAKFQVIGNNCGEMYYRRKYPPTEYGQ